MKEGGRIRRRQAGTIFASVEVAQFLDLRNLKGFPRVLEPGWTIQCQLALVLDNQSSSISAHTPAEIEGAVGRFSGPFLSQPVSHSSITHSMGRVLASASKIYRHRKESLRINECLLEANGTRFIIETRTSAASKVPLPRENDLVQACGTMFCVPSFCDYQLFSPIRARIVDVKRARITSIQTATIWGLLELEINSCPGKPMLRVANVN